MQKPLIVSAPRRRRSDYAHAGSIGGHSGRMTAKTLVWIADDATVRPRVRSHDRPYVQPPDQPPEHESEINQLTALLTAEHERADKAEQRADEANKRGGRRNRPG
jgi:hypothetical protein